MQWRGNITTAYDDVLTGDVVAALGALAPLDAERRTLTGRNGHICADDWTYRLKRFGGGANVD